MANGNGYNGRNGNGLQGNILKEVSSFGFAELASEAIWIGAVAVEDALIPKSLMKSVSGVVGKTVIEPYCLDFIERNIDKVCRLEECKPDMSKPRQERAAQIAELLIKYGPAIGLAWEAKVRARRFLNKKFNLPDDSTFMKTSNLPYKSWSPQERMIFWADEGLHFGSLYVLNKHLAPQTDDMIRSTAGMIQTLLGIPRQKAHEWATSAWVWVIPNGIGALGGSLAITGKHLRDWPTGLIGRFLGRKNGPQPPSL